MGIFEGDDSCREDGSLLCAGEFVLSCGAANDKGICIPWVYICVDSRDLVGDVAGRECTEKDDIFIYIFIDTWIFNFVLNYT